MSDMSDYISRQAAIEALAGWKISPIVLDPVPAADVRENVKGEWVEEYDDDAAIFFKRRWVCSACGDFQTYGKPKFCPNCGAEMGGGS